MRSDGTAFHDDPDLFKYLESKGVERPGGDFLNAM